LLVIVRMSVHAAEDHAVLVRHAVVVIVRLEVRVARVRGSDVLVLMAPIGCVT
jgi:hypothetical protein